MIPLGKKHPSKNKTRCISYKYRKSFKKHFPRSFIFCNYNYFFLLSPFSDGITTSDLDLSISQIGSGGKSQGSLKKKFVAALDKIARRNNSDILEIEQMRQIAMQLGIDNFKNVLESLNEQGYLLKRSAKTYKLLSN